MSSINRVVTRYDSKRMRTYNCTCTDTRTLQNRSQKLPYLECSPCPFRYKYCMNGIN